MVPCAQGRVVVETARPAPPHFATCSTYRRTANEREDPNHVALGAMVGPLGRGALSRTIFSQHRYHRQQSAAPESPAARPDDLGVTPWYLERFGNESPGACDPSSYPSSYSSSRPDRSGLGTRPELSSTKDSSVESSDLPRAASAFSSAPRKAYMDLSDAMALLDETCPNQQASPSLTPKTPRTPLTPFPRSRRARSKSSDNSSNYSNERLSERSLETSKSQDKEKRRPFLRKIGISKTEDRPFLAKIMAPRITGKPYLEKIGPSKAVEKPFLEKIGSSKTLDKFTFETVRELPRGAGRRCQPMEPSPLTIEHPRTQEEEEEEEEEDVMVIVKDVTDEEKDAASPTDGSVFKTAGRRANGKGYLLKMYSFETEDLEENSAAAKTRRDPLRGASLDDVLDSGPASLPPSEDSRERVSPKSDDRATSVAELLTCRVTTSDEIFSTSVGHLGSPREVTSWGNSPRWPRRRSRRFALSPRARGGDREGAAAMRVPPSDESAASSPSKRRISRVSPDNSRDNERVVVSRTKNSSLPRDLSASPSKARRQDSDEVREEAKTAREDSDERSEVSGRIEGREPEDTCARRAASEKLSLDGETETNDAKSRRQNFDEALEKFGGSEHAKTRTRRQVSEEILDRNRENKENGERGLFDDPQSRFERRGISSDNLKLSRETVAVASMPSASSLGYQSGDSSLVSQRSSNHSQDLVRGTFRILHDKFELQDVPVESYAAFKRRTRANYHNHNQHHHHLLHQTASDRHIAGSDKLAIPSDDNEPESQETTTSLTSSLTTSLATASSDSRDSRDFAARSASEENTESKSSVTVKSVLRKQDGVDQQSDNEVDTGSSVRRPRRRIFHEPSQETMDLLTELRKVKSLLKTPSAEGDADLDLSRSVRQPKKILLTDKEFCLSVERENSIRRPSMLDVERTSAKQEQKQKSDSCSAGKEQAHALGPALFEKRCLSLDYADDEKPPKPEPRAISLASARTPRSGTEETIDSSDLGLAYDAKSYSSDVFVEPADEIGDDERPRESSSENLSESKANLSNHCADVDIAIPVDQMGSISPKRRVHVQGRTSDLYEIISPRSTPFRVKKRLGRISVEETVKQESFTLSKVDCRSVVTQKRTKCFPL